MAKRFQKTYLHIGLGKTGTTAIQADILQQAEPLESAHNLHFPRGFPHLGRFDGNHSLILRAMFAESAPVRDKLAAMGLDSEKRIRDYNDASRRCLQRGFDSTPATRLLLSAEGVSHFSIQDLQALADWLGEFSDEIKIIACLRHPQAALSSSIQQVLTIGGVLEELYKKPPIYRFKTLFERLETVFGRDNLLVYDFAAALRDPEPLATVLLRKIGVQFTGQLEKRPAENTSMSHEAALLLSALNRQRPVLGDGKRNPLNSPNAAKRIKQLPGRKFTAPNAVYKRVERLTEPELAWLQENYGLALEAPPPPEPGIGYYRFDPQSIDALALEVAELARVENALVAPFRREFLRLRLLLNRLF